VPRSIKRDGEQSHITVVGYKKSEKDGIHLVLTYCQLLSGRS
jgi:hypothetical protein